MTEIEEINMMLRNNEPLITWGNSHIEVLLRKIKELEEERDGYKNGQMQLQNMINDLMDVNAKWVGKVKELEKAIETHENLELRLAEDKHKNWLNWKQAEAQIKELEFIKEKWESLKFKMFSLNESLCQINEAWKEEISLKHRVERHLKKLQNAVDKHEQFKRSHEGTVSLVDEELYGTINEIHP